MGRQKSGLTIHRGALGRIASAPGEWLALLTRLSVSNINDQYINFGPIFSLRRQPLDQVFSAN